MLLGKPAMERLSQARVAVFGIGGVGGHAAETLARSGIGHIALCDDDVVCLTNINRQILATHQTVGQNKLDAMADRIRSINPVARVTTFPEFFMPGSGIDLRPFDYIMDAVDTVTAKLHLAEQATALGIPIISCMGTGNKLDPTQLQVADIYKTSVCPLAKVMRKECRVRGITALKVVYSQETPLVPSNDHAYSCKHNCICPPESAKHCEKRRQNPGSVAFVPAVAGIIMAGEVVKYIAGPAQ